MITWQQLGKEWLDKDVPDENDYQKFEEAQERLIQQARENAHNEYQAYRNAESTRRAVEEAEKQARQQIEKAKIEIQRKFLVYQQKQLHDLGITPSDNIEDQLKNFHAAASRNRQVIQETEKKATPTPVSPSSDQDGFPAPPTDDELRQLLHGDEFPPPPPSLLHAYNPKEPILAPQREDVILSEKNTLDDLRKYLEQQPNRERHGITEMQDRQTSIELTMRNEKAANKVHKAYAHEKEGDGIIFSIDKNKDLSSAALNQAILDTCRLAVMSAKPHTRFDLNVAPPEKKAVLEKTFKIAIQEAIKEGKFKAENAPKVEDTSMKIPPLSSKSNPDPTRIRPKA